jgi:hypothetical protein
MFCPLSEEKNNNHVSIYYDLSQRSEGDHEFLVKIITGMRHVFMDMTKKLGNRHLTLTAHHHHVQKWQDKFTQMLMSMFGLLTFI